MAVSVDVEGWVGVVGRTEVGVDEVGGVVEFHHCFWLSTFVCEDVRLQAADDEVVVGMLFVMLDVGGVVGRHFLREISLEPVMARRMPWLVVLDINVRNEKASVTLCDRVLCRLFCAFRDLTAIVSAFERLDRGECIPAVSALHSGGGHGG